MNANTLHDTTNTQNNSPHISSKPTMTFIHGWGANNQVWQVWAETSLSPYFQINLVALPDLGQSTEAEMVYSANTLKAWTKQLVAQLPDKTHLVGWSLGGMLAQHIAHHYPSQILSVICIASTPKFSQSPNWPYATKKQVLTDFMEAVQNNPAATLKKFWRLQLQGSDNARPLMKSLSTIMKASPMPTQVALIQGLSLLRDIDNRSHIAGSRHPYCWIQGANDPLIPSTLQPVLRKQQPSACIHQIEGSGHMPFFSHPEQTANLIRQFIHTISSTQHTSSTS